MYTADLIPGNEPQVPCPHCGEATLIIRAERPYIDEPAWYWCCVCGTLSKPGRSIFIPQVVVEIEGGGHTAINRLIEWRAQVAQDIVNNLKGPNLSSCMKREGGDAKKSQPNSTGWSIRSGWREIAQRFPATVVAHLLDQCQDEWTDLNGNSDSEHELARWLIVEGNLEIRGLGSGEVRCRTTHQGELMLTQLRRS